MNGRTSANKVFRNDVELLPADREHSVASKTFLENEFIENVKNFFKSLEVSDYSSISISLNAGTDDYNY
jgi:hypothetical protein